jgi:hypothetical protein
MAATNRPSSLLGIRRRKAWSALSENGGGIADRLAEALALSDLDASVQPAVVVI